jgi:adenosylcobinamide-GDP ribazoletransferase
VEFLLALQFLTKATITIPGPVEEKSLARAMAYFPLVGALLGLSAAVLYDLCRYAWSVQVCDLIVIAYLVIITGNLHGDAVMDTADGIFSGRTREGILEIMKDSRAGAHGVMACCLLILAKFVLLGQIAPAGKAAALVLMPLLGRWAQVYGAAVYQYARTGGGTGRFTEYVGLREIFWASATILAAVFAVLGRYMTGQPDGGAAAAVAKGVMLLGVVWAGTFGLGRYISGKIGGMTGDTLGSMSECIEVLTLLILSIMLAD